LAGCKEQGGLCSKVPNCDPNWIRLFHALVALLEVASKDFMKLIKAFNVNGFKHLKEY
jgi:hypothetical protein